MADYLVVVPENMAQVFSGLMPGLQLLPVSAVVHQEDPEQKKYLVNIEPGKQNDIKNVN